MFRMRRSLLLSCLFPVLRGVCRLWFRPGWVEHGKLPAALPTGVYVTNYASWIDGLLLVLMLDKEFSGKSPDYAVAMNIRHRSCWWARLTAKLVQVLYYDPVRPTAECNQLLADAIQYGRTVIIQPEGRPTDTGTILPVCDTIAVLLDKPDLTLHPIYIEGTERSRFSNIRPRQTRIQRRPKVTLHLYPATHLSLPVDAKGKARIENVARQLYDLLSRIRFEHFDCQQTLFEAVLSAAKEHGGKHIIAEDAQRRPITYRSLLMGSFVLGRALSQRLQQAETTVGVMLPNVTGALVTLTGLLAYGKTPALLNFTAGRANICSACTTAAVETVITSSRFVKMAEMEEVIEALKAMKIRILYLEELRKSLSVSDRVAGLWKAFRGARGYERLQKKHPALFDPNHAAIILFTSGSEGAPKGVVLSHKNLLSNIAQIRSRLDFGEADCFFNPLPIFHTSGLTGGVLLPLLSGMKVFLYPSPLRYQAIPELIADTQSTVLFATDTFLNGYARHARPYDLHRLRYVFAGAEKLRDETRKIWAEKFGVRVFEGYGVTETAPALAFNSPMYFQPGTVGRMLPGVNWRLEPIDGIPEGGRLLVQGPNVMNGYLMPEEPGKLVPPQDGWHDTGDIVSIDDEGYTHIMGRAKRFAKIGGEMVSLGAVEQWISQLWDDADHAVVSIRDSRKGERLLLITTKKPAMREALLVYFRDKGVPELYVPREVVSVEALPLLGSGKVNYPAINAMIEGRASTQNRTSSNTSAA